MSLKIKSLAQGSLSGTAQTPADVYPPTSENLANAVLVKNITLYNSSGAEVSVNLYFKPGAGDKVHLGPKNMKLAPGATFVDAHEIVLEPGTPSDRVQSDVSESGVVDYILNGFERIP